MKEVPSQTLPWAEANPSVSVSSRYLFQQRLILRVNKNRRSGDLKRNIIT